MKRWAAIAMLAGAALVAALVLSRASEEDVTEATAAPVTTSTSTKIAPTPVAIAPAARPAPHAMANAVDTAPSIEDVLAAQSSTAPGTLDVLVSALASTDAVVVGESANALVARGALSALPTLVEVDVVARPWAAPSVIYAMGRIAAKADAEDRAMVVDRLLALMAAEKQRPSNEALANLLHIYEALGQTGDARAIAPLEQELLDARVATAPKVTIVQALVALGARQSRPTLEKVRDDIAPTAIGEDFEAMVRRDLLAAIREALVQLS